MPVNLGKIPRPEIRCLIKSVDKLHKTTTNTGTNILHLKKNILIQKDWPFFVFCHLCKDKE